MASTHPYKVALHCNDKEPVEVNNLATGVIAGLNANLSTFAPTPPLLVTLNANIATLTTANSKLTGYIAGAPGNHAVTTLRNTETITVYGMLNTTFRTLVDGIAAGVKATIELSGFDASADPTAHVIPDIPVISKITDVKQADGHAKVILVKKKKKALTGVKAATAVRGLKYSARITNTPVTAASVWLTELSAVSSTDLILTGLVKLVEISVQVRAEDGKLKSGWSTGVTYASRTSATVATTTTISTTPTPPAG
jgi:hypothetical protein